MMKSDKEIIDGIRLVAKACNERGITFIASVGFDDSGTDIYCGYHTKAIGLCGILSHRINTDIDALKKGEK